MPMLLRRPAKGNDQIGSLRRQLAMAPAKVRTYAASTVVSQARVPPDQDLRGRGSRQGEAGRRSVSMDACVGSAAGRW